MRKTLVALLLLLPIVARAQTTAPAPTPADSFASKLWDDLSDSANFHLFDNAGAGYYLDVVQGRHQSLGGLNTALYEPVKYHTSIDANVAGYQQSNASTVKGFVFPSVTFHFGELSGVQKFESKFLNPGQATINAGVFGARDWNAGLWRAGIYSNLSYFWGS